MTDKKQMIAFAEGLNYGDHGSFILTTFKPNGDVKDIWRPVDYARIYLEPTDPTGIAFKDAQGKITYAPLGNQERAQAVLNAIGKRHDYKAYYDDAEASE